MRSQLREGGREGGREGCNVLVPHEHPIDDSTVEIRELHTEFLQLQQPSRVVLAILFDSLRLWEQ